MTRQLTPSWRACWRVTSVSDTPIKRYITEMTEDDALSYSKFLAEEFEARGKGYAGLLEVMTCHTCGAVVSAMTPHLRWHNENDLNRTGL